MCRGINAIMQLGVYTSAVQQLVAPAGYVKIPKQLAAYYANSAFLPFVNNEVRSQNTDAYKQRFMSIKRLVLTLVSERGCHSWFGSVATVARRHFVASRVPGG